MAQTPAASIRWSKTPWLFPVMAVWVLLVFFVFFHRLSPWTPFPPWRGPDPAIPWKGDPTQSLAIWLGLLESLGAGALIAGMFWSCGKRLGQCFSLAAPPISRFCLEIGLGIFALNTLWMGLGLVRLWFEPLWLTGFVLLTLLLLKDLLTLRKSGFSFETPRGFSACLLGVCALYFLFLIPHSLLPETFYDSLNYFLGMPAFWLFQHGIADYPTHMLSGYFHGGSLFFLNGLVLAGTEGAKVLNAFVLGWIALAAYGWVKELSDPRAGMAAATAVVTFPLLYLNSWAVRVDGLLTFLLLLFFYCLAKGTQPGKKTSAWVVMAGLFAGSALTIKPTAITAIGAALLALLWRDGSSFLKTKGSWLFGGIVALQIGPWFVKNFCFAGNPFFPYALSWMGGRQLPAWSYQRLLHENQQFLPMDHGLLSVLSLPWRFTMPGAGDDQFLGPLFLAFLPILLLSRSKEPTFQFLGRTLLLSLGSGLCLSHMLRFTMPAFILFFLVLSIAVSSSQGRWGALWARLILVSALLCFGSFLSISAWDYGGGGVWKGHEKPGDYLARELPSSYFQMARWMDDNLPKNARVLIVGDARGVYYPRTFYANSAFDEPFLAKAARESRDAEGILARLRELGITHVAVNSMEGYKTSMEYHQYELKPIEWKRLSEFVHDELNPCYIDGSNVAYSVGASPSGKMAARGRNPFLLLMPQAHDYHQALAAGDPARARRDLAEMSEAFPQEKFSPLSADRSPDLDRGSPQGAAK